MSLDRENMEDKDKNCRLRNGLHPVCLANIFQYLDSADLYTLSGMNGFYHNIINDLVISKHELNFVNLDKREIEARQMLERYGKRIRKILFKNKTGKFKYTFTQLSEFITKYCAADQLKSVKCYNDDRRDNVDVKLPVQFRKVEILEISGISKLPANVFDSLCVLRLQDVELNPNFKWTELRSVTELRLERVYGINTKNFIEFLNQRPNIEVFHHDTLTFGESLQDACEAMAAYCGNTIREYSGEMKRGQNMYNFISKFKNIKKACLTTHRICGGDLINVMKDLAINDTIEKLEIIYSGLHHRKSKCIFHTNPNLEGDDMAHFSHLKSIKITWQSTQPYAIYGNYPPDFFHECDPFKLFSVYGSQIMPNVEDIRIKSIEHDWPWIVIPPKLRHLYLRTGTSTSKKAAIILDNCAWIVVPPKIRYLYLHTRISTSIEAAMILAALESVLQKRNNGPNGDDLIEVQLVSTYAYKLFTGIVGRNESIKFLPPFVSRTNRF